MGKRRAITANCILMSEGSTVKFHRNVAPLEMWVKGPWWQSPPWWSWMINLDLLLGNFYSRAVQYHSYMWLGKLKLVKIKYNLKFSSHEPHFKCLIAACISGWWMGQYRCGTLITAGKLGVGGVSLHNLEGCIYRYTFRESNSQFITESWNLYFFVL